MNKIFKGLIRFLIEVIVMTVLVVGINIFTNGMYLWGLPRINDIQSVNITYPSVTDGVQMYRIPIQKKTRCTVKAQLSLEKNGSCAFCP